MTNLLRHAIVGASAALALVLACFPAYAQAAAFAGAMAALLVNLDRCELPQGRRTPIGHSVFALALWTYAASMALAAMSWAGMVEPDAASPLACGFAVGYASHLLLDAISGEGIYIMPNRLFPALEALPEGCERQWAGWSVWKLELPEKSRLAGIFLAPEAGGAQKS
jgi:hypothetical protein